MRFQDLLSTEGFTRFGFALARGLPRPGGKALAAMAAWGIGLGRPEVYDTVHANLRVVLGDSVSDRELRKRTRAVFRHAALTYYDFFHVMDRSREEVQSLVRIDQAILDTVRDSVAAADRGLLILATHMSNFDLAGFAFGTYGFPVLGLTLANPTTGFEVLNDVRTRFGFEIMPITPHSLREAIRRLKAGGVVVTGVDRPIPDDDMQVPFFGRPSFMPSGPARMLALTGAQAMIVSCQYDSGQGYRLATPGMVDLADSGNRRRDIATNAARIAEQVEPFVRAYPEQWMMFHPLWPTA